jgi:hypothetical protein
MDHQSWIPIRILLLRFRIRPDLGSGSPTLGDVVWQCGRSQSLLSRLLLIHLCVRSPFCPVVPLLSLLRLWSLAWPLPHAADYVNTIHIVNKNQDKR